MEIDRETVLKVAHLAKLQFSDEEIVKMQADMSQILSYCQKLDEMDTEGVEPLIFMTDRVNSFREDIPKLEITKEQALQNAPQRNSDYFKVPKFLDRGE